MRWTGNDEQQQQKNRPRRMGKEFMRDEKKPPNGVNGVAFPFLSSLICLDLIQVREGMDAFCLFAHMLQLFSIIPGFGCGYFNFGMFP